VFAGWHAARSPHVCGRAVGAGLTVRQVLTSRCGSVVLRACAQNTRFLRKHEIHQAPLLSVSCGSRSRAWVPWATRMVEPHTAVYSPPGHKEFSDAQGLLNFIGRLRELSGAKPVGFKLCVGTPAEFIELRARAPPIPAAWTAASSSNVSAWISCRSSSPNAFPDRLLPFDSQRWCSPLPDCAPEHRRKPGSADAPAGNLLAAVLRRLG
jgi:hypothetical protein